MSSALSSAIRNFPSVINRLCCIIDGQFLVDQVPRQGLGRGEQGGPDAFQMSKRCYGFTMSLPLLIKRSYSSFDRGSGCHIASVLPHQSVIIHCKKQVPLVCSRRLSSLTTNNGADSSFDDEVTRVCKVIEELFALDRNMEAVLDECRVHISHALVIEVLGRFRHARKPAFRFFNWAGRQPGFSHNSATYNSMMTVLARNRQYESMLSLLEEIGTNNLLTMETFVICIKAFAVGKERKKAIGIIELMKRYDFDAGVETFNILLDSLGRAKLVKEAQVVFEKFKGKFVPNIRTYTVLLNGWCRVKDLMEAGRVWNEIIEQGFKPDVVVFNVMIEGLLRCDKMSDAAKLFEMMKAKGPSPNISSYTLLINDFCKHTKLDIAGDYFNEMLSNGFQPDAATYTSLISGFGNKGRMDMVSRLLNEMKRRKCPPDGVTYNVLIKLMARQKKPDVALKIMNKMIQCGFEPTIHSYNMIMKAYFESSNYENGRAVWDRMITHGCCPDDNSYIVLIRGLTNLGKYDEACRGLEQMLAKGMKAPSLDYNKMASGIFRTGQVEWLQELSQKMRSHGNLDASYIFTRWAQKMTKSTEHWDFDSNSL